MREDVSRRMIESEGRKWGEGEDAKGRKINLDECVDVKNVVTGKVLVMTVMMHVQAGMLGRADVQLVGLRGPRGL